MMRILVAIACVLSAPSIAAAQTTTITGRVVSRDGGAPLGYTTIAVLPQGTQSFTGERGDFTLTNLPPGELRLRFRRLGFRPKDTTLVLVANDTARVRIELTRLVIQLPTVVVDGTCTERTPFETQPASIAEIFDQVKQNAERMRLLAQLKPFTIQVTSETGYRDGDNNIIANREIVHESRPPILEDQPYEPRRTERDGVFNGRKVKWIKLPELPDLADTAFTNNHCLSYAGQERFEADSVIRVDFEPVPWLAKEADIEGRIYLRVGDYQLVAIVIWLNRIPAANKVLRDYSHRARFRELVSGIPVVSDWTLTNVFNGNRPPFVLTGRVTGITWASATP